MFYIRLILHFRGLLGGISTGNGGDVNITAGLDILSYLPSGNNPSGDAGSGAFGATPGDVTLTAGRNVMGHYIVANGAGIINAGNDAGTSASELALSLVSGGWTVNATRDIVLQEVRNPNGIFNNFGFSSSTTVHYFDYAPGRLCHPERWKFSPAHRQQCAAQSRRL